ncbi:serine/threonine-protein phosphatase 6 regulatory ankyrin repeat subunit B [Nematostella vectensis]|nr:serine/threonine-protein phosphatase 6 regulatory ankyrin repeat subunit B [Nematostella vectensis]
MTAIMTSLQILSPIQELPEPPSFTTTQKKNNAKIFFPKKKLARLHGIDPRIYKNILLPISMIGERDVNEKQLIKKRREWVIPKIVIEEVKFPDDCSPSDMAVRTDACGGFLHPSHAVYSAVSANDHNALKNIILSGRVNVNQLNASGVTALHESSYEGKSRCVNVLVQLGADVDCRDREGWTPLHAAVCGGNHKCAAYLLRQGANVRAKNDDGLSPIHIAVQQRDRQMVQLLSSRNVLFSPHRHDRRHLLKAHV